MAKGLGQVAALSHSSLTNDQQHKNDNENHKEGVAIGHHQLHQAGFENLLPSVKKTKRTGAEEKEHILGIWALRTDTPFCHLPQGPNIPSGLSLSGLQFSNV